MAASSSKDGTKGIFKWNIENMVVLCDVCLKFVENNGRNTHFKWKEIQVEVEKKVGCVFTNSNSCKHKYDTMRKDWRNWKDLKSSETGLGWNPVTGKIDASDEWWQRKIKENPDFRKFRQKGVNSTLEERWNNLFGDSYATGKNAFAASLDPDINVEEHDVEYEDFGEDDTRILGSNNYFQSDEFTTELINEDNFFENFLEQAQNSTLENRSGASHMINEGPSSSNLASKRVQKQHLTKNKNGQMKRKGRQSAGSTMLAKQIGEMSECVKVMAQNNEHNVGMQPSPFTISTAMQALDRMVEKQLVEKYSEIWFYATTVITDAANREVFLNMDDEGRFRWLQYLFNKKDD